MYTYIYIYIKFQLTFFYVFLHVTIIIEKISISIEAKIISSYLSDMSIPSYFDCKKLHYIK